MARNTSVVDLCLDDSSLCDDDIIALGHMLTKNKHLKTLSLTRVAIGSEGIACLSQGLQINQSLETLRLSIFNLEDAKALAALLRTNDSLKYLHLSSSRREDGALQEVFVNDGLAHNFSLEKITGLPWWSWGSLLSPELGCYYLRLNRAGRKLLRHPQRDVPVGLWARVLERAADKPDVMYFLRAKPDLIGRDNMAVDEAKPEVKGTRKRRREK